MTKKTTKKTCTTKKAKQTKATTNKPMSGLDAAAKVLSEAKEPMSAKQIVETMLAKGMWKTGGATPHATIYAAMTREIATKDTTGGGGTSGARFKKVARGRFTAA